MDTRLSHLIAKYRQTLDRDPASQVFAPLAECYRKAGMYEECLVVLRDGLELNPHSVLGLIGLAQYYIDQQMYERAELTLRPLKNNHKDNIKLQKLYAYSCFHLKRFEESLESFKYILFLNPNDKEAIEFVEKLENQMDFSSNEMSQIDEGVRRSKFPISKIDDSSIADEWSALDLSQDSKQEDEKVEASQAWVMENQSEKKEEENLDAPDRDDFIEDEERSFEVLSINKNQEHEAEDDIEKPIITHTLVDLYCAQGHYEQAFGLLKKILELNPSDQKTKDKIAEIEPFLEVSQSSGEEQNSYEPDAAYEQEHIHLANIVEEKIGVSRKDKLRNAEEKLWLFHEKLKEHAINKQRSL